MPQKSEYLLVASILIVVCLVLGLTACSTATPLPVPTALLPTTPAHNLLYSLNFDNEAAFSGWHVGAPGQYDWLKNVKDGKYLFEYPSGFLESQDFDFADVQIAVDVEFLVKTRVEISLACRMQSNTSGRFDFTIANDGRWNIRNGETMLAEGLSDQIKPDVNHMAARCVGDQLTLLVNDVELGVAHDQSFTSGNLNLNYAALSDEAGTFDNITVEDWGGGKTSQADTASVSESTPDQIAHIETATPTLLPVATSTPTQIPTRAATQRPTAIPQSELILYQTEFEDADATLANWQTFAYSMDRKDFVTEGYKTWTKNGIYHFEQESNTRVFVIYKQDFGTDDLDISASGSPPFEGHGGMGLVCRYSEAGWYQFMVEPRDGAWSIRLVKPDNSGQFHFHTVSSGLSKWLEGKANLRADCKGDRLTFYINDQKMASVHDSTFPSGKVGFLGWAFAIGDNWNMVDNFTVRRAQWSETDLQGPAPTPGADGAIYSTDFSRIDDLNSYWVKTDWGVIGIPGSPLLIGGPGGQNAPHTYRYINDFDPNSDIEITADIHGAYNFTRGLMCRYSEDGWYEAYYLKDGKDNPITLVRKQREEHGIFTGADTILGTAYAGSQYPVKLTMTCAGNQISVKLNDEQVLFAEDNTWTSGRYGFLFMDNPPGSLRGALLSYTVRKAQPPKGDNVNLDKTFDTPEQIAAAFQVNLEDERVSITDNALQLAPDRNSLHLVSIPKYVNSEMSLMVEMQAGSDVILHCRTGSQGEIAAELRGNGDWSLWFMGQVLGMNNNPSAVFAGENQFVLSCIDDQVNLNANGETLAAIALQEYRQDSGTNNVDVIEFSAPVTISEVRLKTFYSATTLAGSPLLNQVVLPPSYQPGETIYTWDMTTFVAGCGGGWWGRDSNPCWWKKPYNEFVIGKYLADNSILIKSADNILTLFTYQPDLYDLPVELNADVTLTSKGGGVALFCRATPIGRYEFIIQPDGTWKIRRNVIAQYYLPQAKHLTILAHGKVENLSPENMHLSATCSGPDLIFSLNGVEIGRVQDQLYPEGQAGIFFDIYTEGSLTNVFVKRAQ